MEPRHCKECGQDYQPVRSNQRICAACRPAYRKRCMDEYMRKRYYADIEASRVANRAYYASHQADYWRRNRKYQLTVCVSCGARHYISGSYSAREGYLCGRCKNASRLVTLRCYFCGERFKDWPSRSRPTPRGRYCSEVCSHAQTAAAARLGVTRQTVSLGVQRWQTRLGVSRKVALAAYERARTT